MHTYVCTYIYIFICTHMHVCIYIYVYYLYVSIFAYKYICICISRVLTDLSPLLRTLASTLTPTSPSSSTSTLPSVLNVNNLPMDYFPAPEHPSNNILEMSLASLLRPRAPSPPPLRAFRQPISTSAQVTRLDFINSVLGP
jgi:hypothetical protein